MDNSFFAYLEQLEVMVFFSGYPLLYAVTIFIAADHQLKRNFSRRIVRLLPFAYALVGTLYLGLQLKNLYPDYSVEKIKGSFQQPWLMSWALLSVVFWIPSLGKKPVFSLVHSLVLFFFLAIELFVQLSSSADKNTFRNDMKIYTVSLLLNVGAFALIVFLLFLFAHLKKRLKYSACN